MKEKKLSSLQAVAILQISNHPHCFALTQRQLSNSAFQTLPPLTHCCSSAVVLEFIPNLCKSFRHPFTARCFYGDKEQRLENLPIHMTVTTVFTEQEEACTFRNGFILSKSPEFKVPHHTEVLPTTLPQITSLLPGKGTPPSVTAAVHSASTDKLQCPHHSSGRLWHEALGQTSLSKGRKPHTRVTCLHSLCLH